MNITKKIIPAGLTLSMIFSQSAFATGCDKALTKDFQKAFHDARELAVPTTAEANNYYIRLFALTKVATLEKDEIIRSGHDAETTKKAILDLDSALNRKYDIFEDHHVRRIDLFNIDSTPCVIDQVVFPFSPKTVKSSGFTGIDLTTVMCAGAPYLPPTASYSIGLNTQTSRKETNGVPMHLFEEAWQQAITFLPNACPAKYTRPSFCSNAATRDRLGHFCY